MQNKKYALTHTYTRQTERTMKILFGDEQMFKKESTLKKRHEK